MPRPDRRPDIMSAAERLFANRRIHEVTLDMVAQEARVGKGTLYHYFEDKDDLFFQTATSGFDDLCEILSQSVQEQGGFSARLESACLQIQDFFMKRRRLFSMMIAEETYARTKGGTLSERWQERRQKLVAAVAAILEEGVDAGLVRSDISSMVLSNYLLGMLRTRARDLSDVASEERSLSVLLDLFVSGAGTSADRDSLKAGVA